MLHFYQTKTKSLEDDNKTVDILIQRYVKQFSQSTH